jgi:hypothetical protein
MFQAEMAPAPIRGVAVASYGLDHIFGSFIMAYVTCKATHWKTEARWKVPIAIMFIIP